MPRPRLLPVMIGALAVALLARLDAIFAPDPVLVAPAQAQAPPPPAPAPVQAPAEAPAPEAAAERAVLEALRARRGEIEAREAAVAAREQVLAAAERRLGQRVEELVAIQARLEALERERAAREEAGMRGLVRLYEGMRPREAAAILDELEMPVLLTIMDRMREAKASPILGAMRPDRARLLTAELARMRAEKPGR